MKYSVVIEVPCYVVVEADNEDDAEDLALDLVDESAAIQWHEASVVSIEEVVG